MTSNEFCYWLQGYFELQKEKELSFDETQTTILKNHLDMVFEYDSKPLSFCSFLRGFLNVSQVDSITIDQLYIIRQKLSETFKKDIDSRYSERQHQDLQRLHNKEKSSLPSNIQAMC